MFHYRIAVLHNMSFLLQSLVTPNSTLYIPYLSEPSYVFKFLFTKCPYVSFTTSKNILLEFTI
jgi:hypothetical protein